MSLFVLWGHFETLIGISTPVASLRAASHVLVATGAGSAVKLYRSQVVTSTVSTHPPPIRYIVSYIDAKYKVRRGPL